ncbi:MAG: hypothetical protein WBA77_14515 [Microcoleaceae cyanobacterium]
MIKFKEAIKSVAKKSVFTILIAGLLFIFTTALGNVRVANAAQFSNVGDYQEGTGINKELYDPIQKPKSGGMYPYEDMDGDAKPEAKQNAREVMNAVEEGNGTYFSRKLKNLSEDITESAQELQDSAENALERAGDALTN